MQIEDIVRKAQKRLNRDLVNNILFVLILISIFFISCSLNQIQKYGIKKKIN